MFPPYDEAAILTVTGVVVGVCVLYGLLLIGRPLILSQFGLYISIGPVTLHEMSLMALVCLAGLVIGVIPGYRIYRYSLADGMSIRI